MQLIECVPNFSEGKDPEIIRQIIEAITSIPETKLLHQQMDPSHNRSVLTFAGPPEAVIESAFQATKTAAKLIDLSKHKGVHPRTGATDLIPLIPLQNISTEICVNLAQKLATRISEELDIPTHLYEKAGIKSLPEIRKGIPPQTGPGTTIVGVRDILIAYNINLGTDNIKIAKKFALSIRGKNVRALGFELAHKGIVQVSMNLLNFHETSPLKVFKQIEEEAAKHGIEILESELIGCAPRAALPKDFEKSLKLSHLQEEQILENHFPNLQL